ncbi:hypothetical protein DL766_002430 [Monosporascus sp. MC13-8B]|uniref:Uncharacterized protein n=1 Tax=Monosporascus cannonballus TaxID=155416 RepID=A0ABY0GVH2_9PEZI|nr:hypothetical protein DL762_008668 [Monosporascus cannonballus]RYP35573.1 hypothetical protein DL766_002430 [Monosporascus sp. MC13-8B]
MGQAARLAKDAGKKGSPPATEKLKISEPLDRFPAHVFDLADSLEHLDLSGTGLSALPTRRRPPAEAQDRLFLQL